MSSQDAMDFKKALRMFRRLEALHATLSLSGRLMGVLGAVVQVPALPMSHSRQHDFLGRTIAAQFVGDDHAGNMTFTPELVRAAWDGKGIQYIVMNLPEGVQISVRKDLHKDEWRIVRAGHGSKPTAGRYSSAGEALEVLKKEFSA
jgi:hypothetical protein